MHSMGIKGPAAVHSESAQTRASGHLRRYCGSWLLLLGATSVSGNTKRREAPEELLKRSALQPVKPERPRFLEVLRGVPGEDVPLILPEVEPCSGRRRIGASGGLEHPG